MTHIIVFLLLFSGGLTCLAFAWREGRRWTRDLDDLGRIYNCKRWPNEDNKSYHQRLRARIGFR